MTERQLPEQFQDLEPYLAWSLATERERSAKRQASTMTEIQTFYDAMLARMEDVFPLLAQFSPQDVPADVQRLFYLTLSLAEVAPAVENFGQPSVVNGYNIAHFIPMHE